MVSDVLFVDEIVDEIRRSRKCALFLRLFVAMSVKTFFAN